MRKSTFYLMLITLATLLIIWFSPTQNSHAIVEIEGPAPEAIATPTEIPASAQPAAPVAAPAESGKSFPVERFTRYTSPFGYRNHPMGGYRFHYGLDIAAPLGSNIRNWADGVVSRVGSDNACGTHVVVQSGDWSHVYCHMSGGLVIEQGGVRAMADRGGNIVIRQGQAVKAGDVIGRIGMTGSTTGPHLHWGIKYQGEWVDPGIVLRAMVG